MSLMPQGGFTFRQFRWPKFTGGLTFTQAQASDCVAFSNIDMQRDQYVRPRKGIKRLNAAGALGADQVMGLALLSAGTTPTEMARALLMVAKKGATFYYTDAAQIAHGATATFSSFTVPAAPTGFSYVYMDSAALSSGTTVAVMCHDSWPGIVTWDGHAAAATTAASSPPSTTLCAHSDGRIYAVPVSDPMSIRFSETEDPTSWPVANAIGITTQYGPIKRLVSLTDRILIFCENGLLSLQGDPTTQPYISIVHPSVGCTFPGSVSVFGNTIAFLHGGFLYQYSGGASLLSDALRGIGESAWAVAETGFAGALSPFHYLLHMDTTLSSVPVARCFVYERLRYGQWSAWSYSGSSAIGATPTNFSCALWVGYRLNGFVLDGGDGNLYNQEVYQRSDLETLSGVKPGDALSVGTDADGVPVKVTLQTRMEGMNDDLLVKVWRRLQVLGTGTNVTARLYLYDSAGNVRTVTLATAAAMPLDLSVPAVDGSSTSPPAEFTQIQVVLDGDNIVVKDMILDWRPSRYSLLNYS